MATLILSITAAALINSLVSSSSASTEHRSLVSVNTVLRSFADSAAYQIQMQPVGAGGGPTYTKCALTTTYALLSAPTPATGAAGTAATVFATGLPSPSSVNQVTLTPQTGSPTTVLLTSPVPVDPTGAATITFTVPSGLTGPLGQPEAYSISVQDGSVTARSSSDFTVTTGTAATVTSPLAGYHLRISNLDWWNNNTNVFVPSSPGSQGTCQGNPSLKNGGIQQLTATATAPDGSGNTLAFVVTDPGSEYPQLASSQPGVTTLELTAGNVTSTLYLTLNVTGFPAPTLSCYQTGDPSNLCSTGSPLPGGVTFSVNATTGLGLLSGSADAGTGGEYDITVAASSPRGTVTQNYKIIVYQAPAFNPPNAGTLTVGQSGTVTVTASGYLPPNITQTGLPGGVNFATTPGSATMSITGQVTPGVYPIVLTASNKAGSVTEPFTLTINGAPSFTSANKHTFTAGTPGSFPVSASGWPLPDITLKSGTPPADVSFMAGTGTATLQESGPSAVGDGGVYTLVFSASNGIGPAVPQPFTLTVNQAPIFTSGGSTAWPVNQPDTFPLAASGWPTPTFSVHHNGAHAAPNLADCQERQAGRHPARYRHVHVLRLRHQHYGTDAASLHVDSVVMSRLADFRRHLTVPRRPPRAACDHDEAGVSLVLALVMLIVLSFIFLAIARSSITRHRQLQQPDFSDLYRVRSHAEPPRWRCRPSGTPVTDSSEGAASNCWGPAPPSIVINRVSMTVDCEQGAYNQSLSNTRVIDFYACSASGAPATVPTPFCTRT